MGNNNVGVTTSHNTPSTLTADEKRLRAKVRALNRELEFQLNRALRFKAESVGDGNPVRRAAAEVELNLARQGVVECKMALAELETGSVN